MHKTSLETDLLQTLDNKAAVAGQINDLVAQISGEIVRAGRDVNGMRLRNIFLAGYYSGVIAGEFSRFFAADVPRRGDYHPQGWPNGPFEGKRRDQIPICRQNQQRVD